MRRNEFSSSMKRLALEKAQYRCERCWSEQDLELHHIRPVGLSGESTLDNCVVLCHHCHKIAPYDPFLLKSYFLRFASIKELIKYYHAKNEKEAMKLLSKDLNVQYEDLYKKFKANSYSHKDAIKNGMKSLVKRREQAGFNIPYGYRYKNEKLIINHKEMKNVQDIYYWYSSGKSMGEIAKILNNIEVPTKKGGFWAKKTVSSILKNPVYCGYHRWNKEVYKGNHEKIIDLLTFKNVQDIIAEKGGIPTNFDL